jgi:hypothetical protein
MVSVYQVTTDLQSTGYACFVPQPTVANAPPKVRRFGEVTRRVATKAATESEPRTPHERSSGIGFTHLFQNQGIK